MSQIICSSRKGRIVPGFTVMIPALTEIKPGPRWAGSVKQSSDCSSECVKRVLVAPQGTEHWEAAVFQGLGKNLNKQQDAIN